MTTAIPSKDLLTFLKKYRGTDEVTWEDAAEKAHKQFGLVSRYGTPYTGIGFQCFVERKTGQKKWGRQMKPFSKGSFTKKNTKPILLIPAEPKKTTPVPMKAPTVVPVVKPAASPSVPSVSSVPSVDTLDLVQAVVGSDMARNTKVFLVQRLVATLK
jgi:hypothetical protein